MCKANMDDRTLNIHLAIAMILYMFLAFFICFQSGCFLQPQHIKQINYKIEWTHSKPFQLKIHAEIPQIKTKIVNWIRIPIPQIDHHRGWINTSAAHTNRDQYTFTVNSNNGVNTFNYNYSYLFSSTDDANQFRASKYKNDTLFLQPTDLFCIPENISSETVFKIEFVLPDEMPVFTNWKPLKSGFETNYKDLTNSFIFIGAAREKHFKIDNNSMHIVIDNTLLKRNDGILLRSIRQTTQELNRYFSRQGRNQIQIIFRQLDGIQSNAMRRGNTIVIGVSPTIDINDELKKKIAHELVHIYTDTVHNSNWFEESISEYLAWVILARTDQIDSEKFLNILAEKLVQSEYSKYDGLLSDALEPQHGSIGRNYVYSYGFLTLYLLDIKIREHKAYASLETFLDYVFMSTDDLLTNIADVQEFLTEYCGRDVSIFLKRLANGEIDIKNQLQGTDLDLIVKGHTLLEIRNNQTGQYDRLRPDDEIVSINGHDVTQSSIKDVLNNLNDEIASIEIERQGKRVIMPMRIIPRYKIRSSSSKSSAIWRKILK